MVFICELGVHLTWDLLCAFVECLGGYGAHHQHHSFTINLEDIDFEKNVCAFQRCIRAKSGLLQDSASPYTHYSLCFIHMVLVQHFISLDINYPCIHFTFTEESSLE